MKTLDNDVFASVQLQTEDLKKLAESGVKTIINNRPDNEEPGQPSSDALAAAANALGLTYHHIPMAGAIPKNIIEASIAAYKDSPRPIVAFCKSGTRSTALWCFAQAGEKDVDGVLKAAASAGYNLEQLRGGIEAYWAMATQT